MINVSPADGTTAYTKIEAANPGDEVVIAPGTYAFRVFLQAKAPASKPIYIHAQDPTNPPVWDPGGTLVDDIPGSYTAGDKARGCWQVSGGTNYTIEGIVFQGCHTAEGDSAGLRYYNGATGLEIRSCVFEGNDDGLTGGTQDSSVTVEFCEFDSNGNSAAAEPTHNIYIFGGTFVMRYSYAHDPLQNENLHCRATTSTIEYNWFDRAVGYSGDLMTSDDYANNPVGPITQTMTLRGNVIVQGTEQDNDAQLWAIYNDAAMGSPVTLKVTALYNTVIGAGGHAAFLHVSNADGTQMVAEVSNNILSGTSQPVLVEDASNATVSGNHNWIQSDADGTYLSGSITGAAPGYTDAASYDFTLAAGSACVGAADKSVAGQPTAEYFQNETVTREYRPRASALDVGAFEHTTMGPGIGPDEPAPDGGVGPGATSSATTAGGATSGTTTGAGGATAGTTGSGGSAGEARRGARAGASAARWAATGCQRHRGSWGSRRGWHGDGRVSAAATRAEEVRRTRSSPSLTSRACGLHPLQREGVAWRHVEHGAQLDEGVGGLAHLEQGPAEAAAHVDVARVELGEPPVDPGRLRVAAQVVHGVRQPQRPEVARRIELEHLARARLDVGPAAQRHRGQERADARLDRLGLGGDGPAIGVDRLGVLAELVEEPAAAELGDVAGLLRSRHGVEGGERVLRFAGGLRVVRALELIGGAALGLRAGDPAAEPDGEEGEGDPLLGVHDPSPSAIDP